MPEREVVADSALDNRSETAQKPTKKEWLLTELKDAGLTIAYLFVSLSVLQTYKSLILLQQGIHQFEHGYIFALLESILLGKIVALTQKLPFLSAMNHRSRATAILYKAVVMTLITDVAGRLEDTFFPRSAALIAQTGNPLVLHITHQAAAMAIFTVLFTVRALDEALGPGKLWKIFRSPADSKP